MRKIKSVTKQIAKALEITGPFNMQFIAKENQIKVIECNLRASRSFPFVSKVLKINFIDIATRLMLGERVPKIDQSSFDLDYVGVKASQFSFTRLKGSDPVMGVEMASTGEVACLGDDAEEAFLKSALSIGFRVPVKGILVSAGTIKNKAALLDELKIFAQKGIPLFATKGTADFYAENGISMQKLFWPLDNEEPNILTFLEKRLVDLVINIPKTNDPFELENDYIIRRKAVDLNIPLITNTRFAIYFFSAVHKYAMNKLSIKHWDEYN